MSIMLMLKENLDSKPCESEKSIPGSKGLLGFLYLYSKQSKQSCLE